MNALVGVNNSGKSTLLGAFRALDVALRRARSRNPEPLMGPQTETFGYQMSSETFPISLENVHTHLADTDTTISFRLSNGNRLLLYFPVDGGCWLIPEAADRPIRSAGAFRAAYPLDIVVVPVLGPLEHDEPLVQEETLNRNLSTHLASRHFRNYWHYNSDCFEEFADLIQRTWPGMEIEPPERVTSTSPVLSMYCKEKRMTREPYWSGFGFQIWCQLLTHIIRAKESSIVVVDEPEVYLHPDVQRQLLGLLRSLQCDVLLATHSAEIISEADPAEILVVERTRKSAQRLKDIAEVQGVLNEIGSLQNLTITRLARNRRLLFTEGDKDFGIIRQFARQLGYTELSAELIFTTVTSDGQSSKDRVKNLAWVFEKSLSTSLVVGAVYDRDFLSAEEVAENTAELLERIAFACYLERKEIENYLLVPSVIQRALDAALDDKARRSGATRETAMDVTEALEEIAQQQKAYLQGQYIAKRVEFLGKATRSRASITQDTLEWFDSKWIDMISRMTIVSGKPTLNSLRTQIQDRHNITITDHRIIESFRKNEIPHDLVMLLTALETFRKQKPS